MAVASSCLVELPADPFVARFIPAMYIVDGNVPYDEKNEGPMVTGARWVPTVVPTVITGSVWVASYTASSLAWCQYFLSSSFLSRSKLVITDCEEPPIRITGITPVLLARFDRRLIEY